MLYLKRIGLCLLLLGSLPGVAHAEFVDQFFGQVDAVGSFIGTAFLVLASTGLGGWLLWRLYKSWRSWYEG